MEDVNYLMLWCKEYKRLERVGRDAIREMPREELERWYFLEEWKNDLREEHMSVILEITTEILEEIERDYGIKDRRIRFFDDVLEERALEKLKRIFNAFLEKEERNFRIEKLSPMLDAYNWPMVEHPTGTLARIRAFGLEDIIVHEDHHDEDLELRTGDEWIMISVVDGSEESAPMYAVISPIRKVKQRMCSPPLS